MRSRAVTVGEVPWDDPDAVALRRALYEERAARHPAVRDQVEAAGGFPWLDERGRRDVVGTIVARSGGRAVGCVSVRALTIEAGEGETADIGEIRRMFVLPELRGGPLAATLLAAAEELARQRELPWMVLEAGGDPQSAAEHYLAAGYRRIPAFPPHPADAVCYGKDVDLRLRA